MTKARTLRGLTSKKWRINPKPHVVVQEKEAKEEKPIMMSKENAFLIDVYTNISGYENRREFNSLLSSLIRKHAIDVVSEKLYDKHGCRFLDLLISDDDNEFYNLEICFG